LRTIAVKRDQHGKPRISMAPAKTKFGVAASGRSQMEVQFMTTFWNHAYAPVDFVRR
jgi:hypothetical protein